MSWFARLFATLLIAFERLKGTRVARVRVIACTSEDAMRVILNNHQNDVYIFCDEYIHSLHYSAWWARTRYQSVFHVYGLCSAGMSEEDKKRFSSRRIVPSFHGAWWGKAWQRERAIEGYLDEISAEAEAMRRVENGPH